MSDIKKYHEKKKAGNMGREMLGDIEGFILNFD